MIHLKRTAAILALTATFAAVPAAAYAQDNDTDPAGPGGCHYSDSDGYDIPIHNGEDVFVDGKIVSCRNGQVIITTAPNMSTQPPVKAVPQFQFPKAGQFFWR